MQRRIAVVVFRFDIGTELDEQLGISLPACSFLVQGRVSVQILRVDIRPLGDEPPNGFFGHAGKGKCRLFGVAAGCIDSASIEYRLDGGNIAGPDGIGEILRKRCAQSVFRRGGLGGGAFAGGCSFLCLSRFFCCSSLFLESIEQSHGQVLSMCGCIAVPLLMIAGVGISWKEDGAAAEKWEQNSNTLAERATAPLGEPEALGIM